MIILKSVQKEHAKEISHLIEENRIYLKKWLPWVDDTTNISQTESFVKKANYYANKRKGLFCSVLYNDNLVGIVGANRKNDNSSEMFLNYWIGEKYSNQGIATIATKKLIFYLKENWGIKYFYIHSDSNNVVSNRIANKLGFSQLITNTNDENVFLWKTK